MRVTTAFGSKASIRDALAATDLNTIVGPVKFGGTGPMRNVSKTPLVGGQWVKGTKTRYELVIVDNQTMPSIPTGGKLRLLGDKGGDGSDLIAYSPDCRTLVTQSRDNVLHAWDRVPPRGAVPVGM